MKHLRMYVQEMGHVLDQIIVNVISGILATIASQFPVMESIKQQPMYGQEMGNVLDQIIVNVKLDILAIIANQIYAME